MVLITTGCLSREGKRLVPPLDPLNPGAWLPVDDSIPPAPVESEATSSNIVARSQAPSGPEAKPSRQSPLVRQVAAHRESAARPVRNVLALSGGGSYGAFSAGVLHGWSRSGKRPEFDVITGISTGALIAPLVMLGEDGEEPLRRLYTEIRTRDVFVRRSLVTVPFRDAAANAAPLRRIIESTMTPDFVEALAREHRRGRRLYIGTTNLDARRFAVWDIGAIANRNDIDSRKLIVDLLLASCSVPGVFPPVPIDVEVDGKRYTEIHVDGGVTAPLFVPTAVIEAAKDQKTKAGVAPNVYAIVASKLHADPAPVRPRVLKVLGAAANVYFNEHTRAELANLYHASRLAELNFQFVCIRQDYEISETAIEFDPEEMTRMFTEGARIGMSGPKWSVDPPERAPGDSSPIRTGTRFRSRP